MSCPNHGDNVAYVCEHCGRCNTCKHQYVERADGWWKKCPTLRWSRATEKEAVKKGF